MMRDTEKQYNAWIRRRRDRTAPKGFSDRVMRRLAEPEEPAAPVFRITHAATMVARWVAGAVVLLSCIIRIGFIATRLLAP